MTRDELISWMAQRPKSERPTELRSDSKMLRAWVRCRDSSEFYYDVIRRHGLDRISVSVLDSPDECQKHAIGNAWGWLVQSVLK